MKPVRYDEKFHPPAPVLPLRVRIPDPRGWLGLVGLVDTGADATLIPVEVAERYLPVAGMVRVRGVTGHVEEALLYRAEVSVGGFRRVLVLAAFGTEVIVGRDLLNHLSVNLDGPARLLSLQIFR